MLYNLKNTKENRLLARDSYVEKENRSTYKDIEYALLDNPKNIKYPFHLIIFQGTSSKPVYNYIVPSKEYALKRIAEYKEQADKRELLKNTTTRQLSGAALCAKHIKQTLKNLYPNIEFSVKSSTFSMGDRVSVSWYDGMPEKTIDEIIKKYQYGNFDLMRDIYINSNMREDIPQAKYVSASRTISEPITNKIKQDLLKLMDIKDDSSYIPVPDKFLIGKFTHSPDLSHYIFILTKDFDFSKGFTGVRHKISEIYNQPISNLFELY
jgi:hypothetical protein